MPEGDSLHRAARALQALVGQQLEADSPHPRGQVTGVAPLVDGRVLESVEAVGKNLFLRFAGGPVVRSHLRMSGRWRVEPRGRARAGRPWLVLRGETHEAVLWNGPVLAVERSGAARRRLGPDVLGPELDLTAAVARLRTAPGLQLGAAIQDQRLVSGIGNMWMAEALWEVRLSPWSRVADVDDAALAGVVAAARRLMAAALESGRPGRNVYRRGGRPCLRCGAIVRSRGIGDDNRTAYWCPGCQAGGGPPGA
ncbi:MAG TPA: DNA-formamidopyrimidine glycosylase family protein [Gaiellaceae bacterium]|nr:DNA-formamidopyrimidine glycosylase family protein [Gaiellaceae bacterium]